MLVRSRRGRDASRPRSRAMRAVRLLARQRRRDAAVVEIGKQRRQRVLGVEAVDEVLGLLLARGGLRRRSRHGAVSCSAFSCSWTATSFFSRSMRVGHRYLPSVMSTKPSANRLSMVPMPK